MAEAQKATRARASTAKAADDAAPPEVSGPPAESANEPNQPDQPDRVPVERLMRDAVAFTGYPAHVLAGALSGDDREALTPNEARAAAQAWLGE